MNENYITNRFNKIRALSAGGVAYMLEVVALFLRPDLVTQMDKSLFCLLALVFPLTVAGIAGLTQGKKQYTQ